MYGDLGVGMSIEGIDLDVLPGMNGPAIAQNSNNNVGIRLKLIREIYGISQREFAKRAGVTNSSISMIELGQVSPSIQSLERILSVIPIRMADFFDFNLHSLVRVARTSNDSAQLFSLTKHGSHQEKNQLFAQSIIVPVGGSNGLALLECDTCGVVLAGKAQLKSVAVTDSLIAGDTFYIPMCQLYQFINSGDVPLKLFVCSLFAHSR
ncbi:MAG: hypothetical protein B0W54_22220 [Cellvibrio sp. 79]|nr:MAG: hypothetical protein B0W54_22220 [Cellvibrio sp. 79]